LWKTRLEVPQPFRKPFFLFPPADSRRSSVFFFFFRRTEDSFSLFFCGEKTLLPLSIHDRTSRGECVLFRKNGTPRFPSFFCFPLAGLLVFLSLFQLRRDRSFFFSSYGEAKVTFLAGGWCGSPIFFLTFFRHGDQYRIPSLGGLRRPDFPPFPQGASLFSSCAFVTFPLEEDFLISFSHVKTGSSNSPFFFRRCGAPLFFFPFPRRARSCLSHSDKQGAPFPSPQAVRSVLFLPSNIGHPLLSRAFFSIHFPFDGRVGLPPLLSKQHRRTFFFR